MKLAGLLHAPHRLAFAAATAMLSVSAAWWAGLVVIASFGASPLALALPAGVLHGLLMSFGFMPLFFAGFLFTVGPKWLARPPVQARVLLPSIAGFVSGWLVVLAAAQGRDAALGRSLGAIGLGAVALSWLGLVRRFIGMIRASRAAERLHARLIAVAGLLGGIALLASVWGVGAGDFRLVRAATGFALWAFIGLTFMSAAHRLVPFVAATSLPRLDALRPNWLLGALAALCLLEAGLTIPEAFGHVPGTGYFAGRAIAELCAGVGLLSLSVHWIRLRALRTRLTAMLHAGFTWLGVAVLLTAVSHAMVADGSDAGLGLAPLHAYTMGFLGSVMLAMVTRITCAQAGRSTTADDFLWRLFWVLQLATAARLAAVLLPPGFALGSVLLVAAAVGWAGTCLAWAVRYGPWFLQPAATAARRRAAVAPQNRK